MFDFIADWGSESLLALCVFLFLMGWLTPRYTLNREIKNLKEYYEKRLEEKDAHHKEIVDNLRAGIDFTQQALSTSVNNNQRLVGIVDDLSDLTRVATPALVARQDVLEGRHDPQ